MRALVTAELDKNLIPELQKLCELTFAGWYTEKRLLDEDEIINLMGDKEILITSYDAITEKVIQSCQNLQLIICTRANPVNINISAAALRNIPLIYTPGRNSDSTAEYTIAMMLSIARNIPMAYHSLKNGKYLLEADNQEMQQKGELKEDVTWALGGESPYLYFKGFQLKGKTLGLLGYGSIGKKVASLANAFGMNIFVYDPYVSQSEFEDITIKKVSLDELLKNADFITCHCSVTPETRGLISKDELELMKPTAYLINTSRGAIIDEHALIVALRNKKIAGAALDVFSSEPLATDHPFVQELDNVVITPHLGGATYDVLTNHTVMVIDELRRFLNKQTLLFEYDYRR